MNEPESVDGGPGGQAPSRQSLVAELRARGLPLVLHRSDRRRDLLARTSPVLTGCALAAAALWVADIAEAMSAASLEADAAEPLNDGWLLVFLGCALVLCLSPLVAWLVAVALPRMTRTARNALGVLMAIATVAPGGESLTRPWRFALVAAVLVGTYWGIGSILRWAARRSVRELDTLGTMLTRVLPLLLLTFLFFFFNAEIWQLATRLEPVRVWGTVGVIVALAMTLTVVTARDELAETIGRLDSPDAAAPALRRAERVNVLLVTVLVTMMQFMLLAVTVFAFFVLFGMLAVPDATAAAWMGEPPTRLSGPLAQVPVNTTLLKVCLVLGAFSGLNFVAGASTDRTYRATFVEPVLGEVEDGLRVRDAYVQRARRP